MAKPKKEEQKMNEVPEVQVESTDGKLIPKMEKQGDRDVVIGATKDGVDYPAFRMFEPGQRGKKSNNAPCVVAYEPIEFDSLTESQKSELVQKLIREEARSQYDKLSKGYEALEGYLKSVYEMLATFGISAEAADKNQVRTAALALAKKDNIELAFEPVVEIFLTKAQILAQKSEDEPTVPVPATKPE